jgi:hypothetical protein
MAATKFFKIPLLVFNIFTFEEIIEKVMGFDNLNEMYEENDC